LITKYQTNYVPYKDQPYKLTHSDHLLLNLKEYFEQKYGFNTLRLVLPHYQKPDIVHCFDENGKSVTNKIIDCLPTTLYDGTILTKEYIFSQNKELADNADKYKLVAVVVGGWNLYIRGTKTPTGGLRMKLEQLEKIGYRTVLVHWHDWNVMNYIDKNTLVEDLVKRALA